MRVGLQDAYEHHRVTVVWCHVRRIVRSMKLVSFVVYGIDDRGISRHPGLHQLQHFVIFSFTYLADMALSLCTQGGIGAGKSSCTMPGRA